ncbi:hypothetical protein FGB62_100g00 [Gracilaria domingensis]|nr:hypothetical protein FGB62_100g00 [Gracilaria domingensis]
MKRRLSSSSEEDVIKLLAPKRRRLIDDNADLRRRRSAPDSDFSESERVEHFGPGQRRGHLVPYRQGVRSRGGATRVRQSVKRGSSNFVELDSDCESKDVFETGRDHAGSAFSKSSASDFVVDEDVKTLDSVEEVDADHARNHRSSIIFELDSDSDSLEILEVGCNHSTVRAKKRSGAPRVQHLGMQGSERPGATAPATDAKRACRIKLRGLERVRADVFDGPEALLEIRTRARLGISVYEGIGVTPQNCLGLGKVLVKYTLYHKSSFGRPEKTKKELITTVSQFLRWCIASSSCGKFDVWKEESLFRNITNIKVVEPFIAYFDKRCERRTVREKATHLIIISDSARSYDAERWAKKIRDVSMMLQCYGGRKRCETKNGRKSSVAASDINSGRMSNVTASKLNDGRKVRTTL